ncbi:DUF4254 domain-containing protein [bacterium]|nr:DUF4254 domain-containing protein [bacterium]
MTLRSFPSASDLTQLQIVTVVRWHQQPIDNHYDGINKLICEQHECNYRLWHKEDIARSPKATAKEIANVKREIDKLNQTRNDMIEKIDDSIAGLLTETGVQRDKDAKINTETVGSAIDRLSIMALRLYHYREQLQRHNADPKHLDEVSHRVALCEQQHGDLTLSLQQLLDDLFFGRKQHRTYRQLKMYNDPTLNPAIYEGDQEQ